MTAVAGLRVAARSGGVEVHPLSEPTTTVGRAPECDIVLDDPAVSRAHIRFECEAGRWRITDLGSSNGTLYNNSLLRPWTPQLLGHGDVVQISDTRIEIDLADARSGVATSQSLAARAIELTPAETEVLELLFVHYDEGRPTPRVASIAEIAERRFTTADAVKLLLRSLYNKFDLIEAGERNKENLAVRAQELRVTRPRF